MPDLRKVWADATQGYREWTAADRPDRLKAATQKMETAIDAALDAGQAKRLRQLALQRATQGRAGTGVFTNADVVRELKVTDDQKGKLAGIVRKQRDGLAPLFLTGKGYEAISADVTAHHKKTYDEMLAVLSADQQKQLKDLLGEPFAGQFTGPDARGPGGGGAAGPGTFPRTSVRLLQVELLLVSSPDLAKDLKLADDDVKKLTDLRTRYTAENRVGANPAPDRDKLLDKYEKELTDLLGADKRKRMRQVVLQFTTQSAGAFYRSSVLPEVEKELKLTDDQKKQVTDGTALAKVLTDDQQKKWKEMTGEPFAGTLQLGFGGGAPGGGTFGRAAPALPARAQFAGQKSVQDELKLSDDQKKQVADLDKAWQEAVKGYQSWTAQERTEKLRAATADLDAGLKKALQPAQAKRFEQVLLQRGLTAGGRAGTPTLTAPSTFARTATTTPTPLGTILAYAPVAKELSLTDKQQEEVKAAAEASRTLQLFTTELRTGPEESISYADARQKLVKMNDEKVAGPLTADRKAKLKELVGEPFTGELTPARAAGRGGRGGTVPPKGR